MVLVKIYPPLLQSITKALQCADNKATKQIDNSLLATLCKVYTLRARYMEIIEKYWTIDTTKLTNTKSSDKNETVHIDPKWLPFAALDPSFFDQNLRGVFRFLLNHWPTFLETQEGEAALRFESRAELAAAQAAAAKAASSANV